MIIASGARIEWKICREVISQTVLQERDRIKVERAKAAK